MLRLTFLACAFSLLAACAPDAPAVEGAGGGGGSLQHPEGRQYELDFGKQVLGRKAERTLVLRNDGPAARALGFWDVDYPFALLEAPREIPSGGEAAIRIAFRADDLGTFEADASCWLGDERITIGLRGAAVEQADAGCIEASPSPLVFAATCAPATQQLIVRNHCDVATSIADVTWQEPGHFEVIAPAFPVWLEPGGEIILEIAHDGALPPGPPGVLALQVGVESELLVEMVRPPAPPQERRDVFKMEPRPRNDILFVVDDSPAFEPYRERLDAFADRFLGLLIADGQDFRLAVTTTSTSGSCAVDGALLPIDGSRPQVLERTTPGSADTLVANLAAADCPRTEPNRGLEASGLALYGDAAGWIREDANLMVVFISADDDASPLSTDEYLAALWEKKGYRNSQLLSAHAIVPADCADHPDANRYLEVVQNAGGLVQPICEADWSRHIGQMIGMVFHRWGPDFYLSSPPVDLDGDGTISHPDELEVFVEGESLPPLSAHGSEVWSYSRNKVRFAPLFLPEPGSTVEIRYAASCSEP